MCLSLSGYADVGDVYGAAVFLVHSLFDVVEGDGGVWFDGCCGAESGGYVD